MTADVKSRVCWLITLGGGIPLTALITWIFTAGTLRGDFDAVKAAAYKSVELNQAQEMRLQKLELNYEHLKGTTDEIKSDVKDIKRIVERKP
ncbi:MAG: hypothetical protein WC551_13315 [Patescibacteria group bacterium]